MRLLLALCLGLGMGAMLVGSAAVAPSAGVPWPGPGGGTRPWGSTLTPASLPWESDQDEPEETTCPDWRVRQ